MVQYIYDGVNMCCSECLAKTQIRIPHHNSNCSARETTHNLTQRERTVAILLSQGKTSKDVATALSLSIKTVEVHLCHIYRKLNVHNRAELIRRIVDEEFAEKLNKAVQEKLESMRHSSDVSPKSPKPLLLTDKTLLDVKQ